MLSVKKISAKNSYLHNVTFNSDTGTLFFPGYSLIEHGKGGFMKLTNREAISKSDDLSISSSKDKLDIRAQLKYDCAKFTLDFRKKTDLNVDLCFTNCSKVYLNGIGVQLTSDGKTLEPISSYINGNNLLDITLSIRDKSKNPTIKFSSDWSLRECIKVTDYFLLNIGDRDGENFDKNLYILSQISSYDEKLVIDLDNQLILTNKFSNVNVEESSSGVVFGDIDIIKKIAIELNLENVYCDVADIENLKLNENLNISTESIECSTFDVIVNKIDEKINLNINGETITAIDYITLDESRLIGPGTSPYQNYFDVSKWLNPSEQSNKVVILEGTIILKPGNAGGKGTYPGEINSDSDLAIPFSLISRNMSHIDSQGKTIWEWGGDWSIRWHDNTEHLDKFGYMCGNVAVEAGSLFMWKYDNMALKPVICSIGDKTWLWMIEQRGDITDKITLFGGTLKYMIIDTVKEFNLDDSNSYEVITDGDFNE